MEGKESKETLVSKDMLAPLGPAILEKTVYLVPMAFLV